MHALLFILSFNDFFRYAFNAFLLFRFLKIYVLYKNIKPMTSL